MKKRILLALGLVSLLALAGCGKKAADTKTSESASESVSESAETSAVSKDLKTITVGATPAPHAEILEAARKELNKEGYDLKIVEYNDYIQPNVALDTKELDANYFQHYPYLENFNKEHNTTLVSAGESIMSLSASMRERLHHLMHLQTVQRFQFRMMPQMRQEHCSYLRQTDL